MTFSLPEDDQEYLQEKGWKYELLSETMPDGTSRNAVHFPEFSFDGDLYSVEEGQSVRINQCAVLVLIPTGYATTRLDSHYTIPRLKRADGGDPVNTSFPNSLFQREWQFWSRHLEPADWRAGIDGIETFILYILEAFRTA